MKDKEDFSPLLKSNSAISSPPGGGNIAKKFRKEVADEVLKIVRAEISKGEFFDKIMQFI